MGIKALVENLLDQAACAQTLQTLVFRNVGMTTQGRRSLLKVLSRRFQQEQQQQQQQPQQQQEQRHLLQEQQQQQEQQQEQQQQQQQVLCPALRTLDLRGNAVMSQEEYQALIRALQPRMQFEAEVWGEPVLNVRL